MARRRISEAEARPVHPGATEFGSAETLGPVDADALQRSTARESAGRAPDDGVLPFPGLDGADDRRMEDVIAARLFPRRAAQLTIGRYTILDKIGQGGMGIVYAAYDPELDRRVAIKLLTETLGGHAEARMLREAQAMARVAHANVVSVIEVGQHEGRTFVVMEYLRGISLDRWRERQPGWRDTLGVYIQAGRGLAAAHRAGVIHRDFKPHNAVLIEQGVDAGRVKVLDFGLARAANEGTSTVLADVEAPAGALAERLTRTGALMGTPVYMAPEQLAGEPASERSDQYSFAVSLYEALYGRLPFAADSLAALTHSVLTGEVGPPPVNSQVPAWVRRAVLRGLARDPGARFESMLAMCDALERDPGARRRNAGLALVLAASVGAGGWGLARISADEVSPCTGPNFELGDVWNDARAAAVENAFAATGLPYAIDAARRVRPILDDHARGWTTMRRATCEAHRRGEQSAQLLDLRMACLDHRRTALGTLVNLFVAADATAVERAVEAALELPALDACADTEALTTETRRPDDPALAREVADVRARLAEVGALGSAGRLDEAAVAGEALLRRAEDLAFAPVVADAALAVGSIYLEQGRGEDADRALTRAAHEGIEGRADRVTAEALVRRLFVRGELLGQKERAADDENMAAAHAARFPSDGALQWLTYNNRGVLAHNRNEFEPARGFYQRALAVERGPTSLELARTRMNLGILAADGRDFEAALEQYRAAIDRAVEVLGEQHPLVAQFAHFEATALWGLGDYGAARERFEALLARLQAAGTDTALTGLWPRIYLARLDARLGRYPAAREHARRARALATEPLEVLNADAALADASADVPEEALALHAAVVERCTSIYGEHDTVTGGFLQRATAGMLRLGRAAEALPIARRSLASCEAIDGPRAATTARSRQLLADALLALGQRDEALVSARAAVDTLAALPGDHTIDRAHAHLSLGRALLAAGDSNAAHDALLAARELAARRLTPDDPDLLEIDAELARARTRARP